MISFIQRRLRSSNRSDAGFTLVEVMAALVVLTVAMSGLAAATIAGLRATQATEFKSAALEIAKDRLEALRTTDWQYLGHYQDESQWGSGYFNGESLVSVAATTPTPRPAGVPSMATEVVNVEGVAYNVVKRVTWSGSSTSSPNTGSTYAAKRMSVDVTYSVKGASQSVHIEGIRAPNNKEMKASSTSSIVDIELSNVSAGADQTLDATGNTTTALSVFADTDVVGESVSVVYTLSSGDTASVDLTADATGKHWTGAIPVGTGPFDPGSTSFTFTAQHSSGSTTTATDTVTFSAPTAAFALTDASVTITNAQLVTGYYTQAPISLSVKASSAATAVSVTYPEQGGTTSSPVNLSYNGTAWVGTIATNTGPMTPGNVTFTFSGTSVGGQSASTTASLTLAEPTLGAISILTPTAAPSPLDVNNSTAKLSNATTFTVEVLNVDATGNSVTIKVGSLAAQPATALGTTGPSGGQLFKVTVAKNAVFSGNPPTTANVVINVTRSADGATANATYSFSVV